ncbi:MAG: metallophosphoesterase [Clostridia bacterium]|nr:metallophosphoesterase [Clostridia bacterium]
MLRILHMGDLHLGAPLAGFSGRVAAAWRERRLEALEETLATAMARGVQLILMAGDCFDSETPDPNTVARFFSLLAGCRVPVVIAPGNHDPYRCGGVWDSPALPANVLLFKEAEPTVFSLPVLGVNVYGYAFVEATHAAPVLPSRAALPTDRINILLAHADMLSLNSPHAPLSARALADAGFLFAALGHVHNAPDLRRLGETVAAYSGFFAGGGFDECGKGRVNLVEIEGTRVSVTPLETGAGCFYRCPTDCTGLSSGEAVRERVARTLREAGFSDENAIRVELFGETAATCTPDPVALSRLGTRYALFEVKDKTVPLLERELLEREVSLRGAFYRALRPRLESEDPAVRDVAAEALRLGLAALSGRELL